MSIEGLISVDDLAFELWFRESGRPEADRSTYRMHIFDRLVTLGKLSEGMKRAYRAAVIVLELTKAGKLKSVTFRATDGVLH